MWQQGRVLWDPFRTCAGRRAGGGDAQVHAAVLCASEPQHGGRGEEVGWPGRCR